MTEHLIDRTVSYEAVIEFKKEILVALLEVVGLLVGIIVLCSINFIRYNRIAFTRAVGEGKAIQTTEKARGRRHRRLRLLRAAETWGWTSETRRSTTEMTHYWKVFNLFSDAVIHFRTKIR
jgi:hypothetical protein